MRFVRLPEHVPTITKDRGVLLVRGWIYLVHISLPQKVIKADILRTQLLLSFCLPQSLLQGKATVSDV